MEKAFKSKSTVFIVLLIVMFAFAILTTTVLSASPDKVAEASAEEIPGHIGLFNTNSRIKLIFGEEYGLTVLSDENNGTVVRIRYPAVETMPQREQPHKTTAAVTAP